MHVNWTLDIKVGCYIIFSITEQGKNLLNNNSLYFHIEETEKNTELIKSVVTTLNDLIN